MPRSKTPRQIERESKDLVCGIEVGSREYQFCEARLLGMNQTQAARHAGFSRPDNKGTQLSRDPRIQRYLSVQREVMRQASKITREDVLTGFRDAIEDAKLLSDPQAQISGWREIGKMLGFYEPETKRIELTVEQRVTRDALEAMAEDELLRLAAEDGYHVEDADFDFTPAPAGLKGPNDTKSKH